MIQNNITPIVIVLGAVLLLAVTLIVYLFLRIRRIEADSELLVRDTHGQNFVQIVSNNIAQVENLLIEVERLSEQYAQVLRRMAGAVQHIGVVRFDAFRDLGGLLSFAVALLDDRGNGLVFSSIYGRSESRTYAKPVVERSSSYELSPEEREAIRLAMQSKELGALPVEAHDREHEERMANLRLFHDREYLQRSNQVEARPETRTEERRPARRVPSRQEDYREEKREERTPAEQPRQPNRSRNAGRHAAARRSLGRVRHVGPPAERQSTERATEEPVEERKGPPVDLIGELIEEPFEERPERPARNRPAAQQRERTTGGASDSEAERRPESGTRPRGLNTPVERLRDREPRGE